MVWLVVTQGFEIHGSTGAPLPEKNNGWQKKLEEYLKKKRKEWTQNADFQVPLYDLHLEASGSSAPWIPAKGLASRPRLHDKLLKDGAILQIL